MEYCSRQQVVGENSFRMRNALRIGWSIALALLMCIVMWTPSRAYAFWHETGWMSPGCYDTSWYDGSGDYRISNGAQLAGLSYLVGKENIDFAGATITLTSDIDISGNQWQPIGKDNSEAITPFRGTFDGNGHTVSGLTINGGDYKQGLFGVVDGALIKKLVVRGDVTGSSCVAGIVAECTNTSLVDLASYVNVTATGGSSDSDRYNGNAAGVVCYAPTTVDGTQYFQKLYNYGTVTGAGKWTAGVIGFMMSGSTGDSKVVVSQCANYADVTVLNCANATGSDDRSVGGVVGATSGYGTYQISECLNSGSISSGNLQTSAGVVGSLSGANSFLTYSYNTGSVNGSYGASGVVGNMTASGGQVANCYNAGTVEGSTSSAIVGTSSASAESFASGNYYLEGSAAGGFGGIDAVTAALSKTYDEMISQDILQKLTGGTGLFSGQTADNNGMPWLTWQGFAIPGGGIGDDPGDGDDDNGDDDNGGDDPSGDGDNGGKPGPGTDDPSDGGDNGGQTNPGDKPSNGDNNSDKPSNGDNNSDKPNTNDNPSDNDNDSEKPNPSDKPSDNDDEALPGPPETNTQDPGPGGDGTLSEITQSTPSGGAEVNQPSPSVQNSAQTAPDPAVDTQGTEAEANVELKTDSASQAEQSGEDASGATGSYHPIELTPPAPSEDTSVVQQDDSDQSWPFYAIVALMVVAYGAFRESSEYFFQRGRTNSISTKKGKAVIAAS